jgi:hypothetical protein
MDGAMILPIGQAPFPHKHAIMIRCDNNHLHLTPYLCINNLSSVDQRWQRSEMAPVPYPTMLLQPARFDGQYPLSGRNRHCSKTQEQMAIQVRNSYTLEALQESIAMLALLMDHES